MNAKTSFFNRKIFSENVRRILPFALIVLVIEILLLINNLRNIFTTDFFTQEMTAKTVNILSMIKSADIYVSHTNTALRDINQFVMAFYTFCCGVACFYYMFQHKISRTIHALPLTRNCLYISSVISGFILSIAPFVLSGLTAFVYLLIKTAKISYAVTVFPAMAVQIAYIFVFFSLTILAVMLTGHIIAVPVMFGFLNLWFFAAENLCMLLIYSMFFGLTNTWNMGHTIFTPFIYILQNLGIDYETTKLAAKPLKVLAVYCIIGAILLVLANILYNKKNLENQGDPITAKKLEPVFHYVATLICSGLLTLAMFGMFYINYDKTYFSHLGKAQLIIIFLLSSVVIFYIIKMLFNKTIKVFSTKNPGLFVYIGISIVIFASVIFDIYGVEKKMPDINSVESAKISYGYGITFTTDNQEEIAEFMNIHKQLIDSKEEILANDSYLKDNSNSYYIQYNLKNGKKITRSYSYDFNTENQNETDKSIQNIDNEINNAIDKFNILYNALSKLNNIDDMTLYKLNNNDEIAASIMLSPADYYEIFEAAKKDVKSGNIVYNTMYVNSSTQPEFELDISSYSNYDTITDSSAEFSTEDTSDQYYELYINSDCTNTIEALQKCGVITSDGDFKLNENYNSKDNSETE